MTEENNRSIEITRLRKARFLARNQRGGELEFGEGDDAAFSPVELLLAAIAGCTAIDVDYITAKRAEADSFELTVEAQKIRDEHGNRLTDLVLTFGVEFADDDGGRAAAAVLPRAVQQSHDRLCTVSRTVEVGTPIVVRVD
jgi:uncharacterized OsmC-like protein